MEDIAPVPADEASLGVRLADPVAEVKVATTRVAASEIYRISESDLTAAVRSLEAENPGHGFSDSTHFDVLIDEWKRYAPKEIVGVAAETALGRILTPADFTGGEGSPAFRLLLDRGFEIVTKTRKVESLDATFSVGQGPTGIFLIFESRGPDRNTQYAEGLEAILYTLSDLDATLENVRVASSEAQRLSPAERQLVLPGSNMPLRLREVGDIGQMRRELGSLAAAVGRTRATGGNSTKRLRLGFRIDEQLDLRDLADVISQDNGGAVGPARVFTFKPSAPSGSGDIGRRRALPETRVTKLHFRMQQRLYRELVEVHGKENVATEQPMACGRPADVVVRHNRGYDIYELKTASTAHECVRQALGQILEYAYWPGSKDVASLWIVGPAAQDTRTQEYIDTLRSRFQLPIAYLSRAGSSFQSKRRK